MFMLKNRNYPEPSEVNFYMQDSSHSNELLKHTEIIVTQWLMGIILFTDEKIFTVATPKDPPNDQLYAHLSTKKKDVVRKCLLTH